MTAPRTGLSLGGLLQLAFSAVFGWECGQLVEGDFGDLTFQGTRYLSFVRR